MTNWRAREVESRKDAKNNRKEKITKYKGKNDKEKDKDVKRTRRMGIRETNNGLKTFQLKWVTNTQV